MKAADALANLRDATVALTAAGGRPFLVDGTLLGAVREGGFLAHDKDVDLGLFRAEAPADVVRRMTDAGFALHRHYGSQARGEQWAFKRRGVKVDVFVYYADPERGEVYHAAWLDGTPIRYGYPAFELAPLELLGHRFLAPADPVAFLVAKYGPGWSEPVLEWDWAWGPANARAWGLG